MADRMESDPRMAFASGTQTGTEARRRLQPTVRVLDVYDAALTLFAERGYHGATMSDIARRVGIQTPSLYNHIRSKEEILRDIVVSNTQQVLHEFDQAVDGIEDPAEKLTRATRTYVLRHITHPREALVVNRDVSSLGEPIRSQVLAKRRQHERSVRAVIVAGCESGHFRVESPALASFAILEMCVSVARWFRPDGPLTPEEVATQYSEFAVRIVNPVE